MMVSLDRFEMTGCRCAPSSTESRENYIPDENVERLERKAMILGMAYRHLVGDVSSRVGGLVMVSWSRSGKAFREFWPSSWGFLWVDKP